MGDPIGNVTLLLTMLVEVVEPKTMRFWVIVKICCGVDCLVRRDCKIHLIKAHGASYHLRIVYRGRFRACSRSA